MVQPGALQVSPGTRPPARPGSCPSTRERSYAPPLLPFPLSRHDERDPATITTVDASVAADSPSPPNAQPTSSATTGFTKAYVPTSVGGATRRSHVNAVKPISDGDEHHVREAPQGTRGEHVRVDARRLRPGRGRPATSATPPASSCMPLVITRLPGAGRRRDRIEPEAQASALSISTSRPADTPVPGPTRAARGEARGQPQRAPPGRARTAAPPVEGASSTPGTVASTSAATPEDAGARPGRAARGSPGRAAGPPPAPSSIGPAAAAGPGGPEPRRREATRDQAAHAHREERRHRLRRVADGQEVRTHRM